MRGTRILLSISVLAVGSLLAACGSGDAPAPDSESPAAETVAPGQDDGSQEEGATEADGSESEAAESDDECFIHLFDGDNFDESDDNFQLTEPGDYENLADLPGADKDWTDEADSLKVGQSATVTIYSEEGFEGQSQDLDPGTELADVDDEPQSLKMTCN